MLTHAELKNQAFKSSEVQQAYAALEPEYKLVKELLQARVAAGLTQAEVAERMHTKPPAIARLEGAGKHSPSVETLRKYAAAVNCSLEIRLVPQAS